MTRQDRVARNLAQTKAASMDKKRLSGRFDSVGFFGPSF